MGSSLLKCSNKMRHTKSELSMRSIWIFICISAPQFVSSGQWATHNWELALLRCFTWWSCLFFLSAAGKDSVNLNVHTSTRMSCWLLQQRTAVSVWNMMIMDLFVPGYCSSRLPPTTAPVVCNRSEVQWLSCVDYKGPVCWASVGRHWLLEQNVDKGITLLQERSSSRDFRTMVHTFQCLATSHWITINRQQRRWTLVHLPTARWGYLTNWLWQGWLQNPVVSYVLCWTYNRA